MAEAKLRVIYCRHHPAQYGLADCPSAPLITACAGNSYFLRIKSLILLLCSFISKVTKFRFWRHFSIVLCMSFCALVIHFLDWMTPSLWKILKQPQNFGQNCQKVWNFALRAFSDYLRALSSSRLNFKGRMKVNTDFETLKDSNVCSHSKFYW